MRGSQSTNNSSSCTDLETPDYQREDILREAYERADGDLTETAQEFDASRSAVSEWLSRYGIRPKLDREEYSLAARLEAMKPDDADLGNSEGRV
jgi:hypothetical protein